MHNEFAENVIYYYYHDKKSLAIPKSSILVNLLMSMLLDFGIYKRVHDILK